MNELVRIFGSFPLEFAGGGELSCSNIAHGLAANGFRVEYVCDSGYNGVIRISTEEAFRSLVRGFSYLRLPFEKYPTILPAPLYRALPSQKQLTKADLNLLLLDRIPPLQFLSALRAIRVPTVLLLHGLTIEPEIPPDPLAAAYSLYLRSACRAFGPLSKSPHVHFQVFAQSQQQSLVRLGIDPSHIFIIPSGIDLSQVPPPSNHEGFGVLFLGRIERVTKGIDFLLRVLRSIERVAPPGLDVNIVGSGRDQGVFNEFSGSSIVHYHGFVDDARKKKILQRSDVSLTTSYFEPFSLSLVEALASGAMVFTTPCSGPSSIVDLSPLLGKVLTFDPDLFVSSVMEVYARWKASEDQLLAERVLRSSFVRPRFSSQRMAKDYVTMIQQLLGGTHD